jgi:betaine/carnitine transporter, BCCT family
MNGKNSKIDPQIFWPALLVVLAICIPAATNPEASAAFLGRILSFITSSFGWLYLIFGLGAVIFLIWLSMGKYGNVKLGGPDDKPEYSTFAWVSMLFCAGIGSSLVYWSIIEPIYYIQGPPFGIEPYSQSAFEWAGVYGPFHWGITVWAIYCLPVVPIAYSMYVRRQNTMRISTASIGVIGEKNAKGVLGKIFDIFVMFGLIGGVGTTLGLGTPMVSALINRIFNVPESMTLNVIIVLIWTLIFGASVYRGLDAGIKHLSTFNTYLALILAGFILLAGPTFFLFNNFTNVLHLQFQNFIAMSLWTDPIAEGGFPQGWTIFYWAWWLAYAPFVGLFVARISKGRTIKQTILGMVTWGTAGCWLYFMVLGGFSTHLELNGGQMTALMSEVGPARAIAAIIEAMPAGGVLLVGFLILQFVFLATTLDSAAYTLASIATKEITGEEEPARWNRFVWCAVLAGAGLTLMVIGGLGALQTSSIVASLPLIIILTVLCFGFLKHVKEDYEAVVSPLIARPVLYDKGVRISGSPDSSSEDKVS